MNEITERTARNLRMARERAGLTRPELAEKMECHPNALYLWETGKREIGHEALSSAAKILGRSWLWFYQDNADQTQPEAQQAGTLSFSDQDAMVWARISLKRELKADLTDEEKSLVERVEKAAGDGGLSFC